MQRLSPNNPKFALEKIFASCYLFPQPGEKRELLILIAHSLFIPVKISPGHLVWKWAQSLLSARPGSSMQAAQDSGDGTLCPQLQSNSHDITQSCFFHQAPFHSFLLYCSEQKKESTQHNITNTQIHKTLRQTVPFEMAGVTGPIYLRIQVWQIEKHCSYV